MLQYLARIRQYMALWGAYMLAFYLSLVVFGIVALIALATHNIGSIDTSILDGLSYQTDETSGILELWLHEIMRAAPMLVPGAGAVWGFIVAFTSYPAFIFLTDHSNLVPTGTGAMIFFAAQPFLAPNVLAHIILMKHSITWAKAIWSMRYMDNDGRLETARTLARPTAIGAGVAIACLLASAVIVYVASGDAYSPAAINLGLIADGAIEKMAGFIYHIAGLAGVETEWTTPDWDEVLEALL